MKRSMVVVRESMTKTSNYFSCTQKCNNNNKTITTTIYYLFKRTLEATVYKGSGVLSITFWSKPDYFLVETPLVFGRNLVTFWSLENKVNYFLVEFIDQKVMELCQKVIILKNRSGFNAKK